MRPEMIKTLRITGKEEDSKALLEVLFNELVEKLRERHSVDIDEVENERVGIRADVLVKIIKDLDENVELQEMFGRSVSRALIVIADNNDLRVEEGGVVEIGGEGSERFVAILNEIIKKRVSEDAEMREGG